MRDAKIFSLSIRDWLPAQDEDQKAATRLSKWAEIWFQREKKEGKEKKLVVMVQLMAQEAFLSWP